MVQLLPVGTSSFLSSTSHPFLSYMVDSLSELSFSFLAFFDWLFIMSYRRDNQSSRAALFDNMDSLEEGGLRSSTSYSSGIDDHDNEKTMGSLQVSFLKRVFEKKSNRRICTLPSYLVVAFFVLYYIIRVLLYGWIAVNSGRGN